MKCMSNGLKNLQSHARSAARRERIEQGLPPVDPYNDDSGCSGIDGLTPVDEMGPEDPWGSPDRRSTSNGSIASQPPYGGASNASSTYGLHPVHHHPYQHHGGHHSYSSSVSSSTAGGYGHVGGHDAHSQSPSPYMDSVSRMPSVDMGIDSIINRPGAQQ